MPSHAHPSRVGPAGLEHTGALDRLLTPENAAALTGMSQKSLVRMAAAGLFPQPVRIGLGRVRRTLRWRYTDVQRWITEQGQG